MNYRRKDYFTPSSMREAFGRDDTFEPEIRCCSELFNQKQSRPTLPLAIILAIAALVIVQIVVRFAH